MTIFSGVTGFRAIAFYFVFLDRTLSTVFTRIWPFTWIDELAIVQSNFAHDPFSVYHISRLNNLVIDLNVSHATDQACITFATAYDDLATELERHCEKIALLVSIVDEYAQFTLCVIQLDSVPRCVVGRKFYSCRNCYVVR